MEVTVARKVLVAQDACEFELVSPDGESLPAFSAGAHIDVHVPGGVVRQYSLCNAPAERHRYVIGVLRDLNSRGGSQGMHDTVQAGDRLTISEPRNLFPLTPGTHPSLLFAGGIGITPLLSMAEHLNATGAPFEMRYCCRSSDRAAFQGRIAQSGFAGAVAYHFDEGAADQAFQLDRTLAAGDRSAHIYVCGPAGFIDSVLAGARRHGWDEDRLHSESFTAPPQLDGSEGAFTVELAKSGRTVTVPADQTVVEALAAAGIVVPMSCEQGICGTCLTTVLAGEPDHRDMFLTPDEQARNDCFTPCCSRAKSATLILDL